MRRISVSAKRYQDLQKLKTAVLYEANDSQTGLIDSNHMRESAESWNNKNKDTGSDSEEESDVEEFQELEAMLNDYNEAHKYIHLFTGSDELYLTKIDQIFELPIYDIELVGIDEATSYELHAIGGGLIVCPLAALCSFWKGELPVAYEALVSGLLGTNIVGPFGSGLTGILVTAIFALLFALRPYFLHKLVYYTSPFVYFSVNMFCYYLILVLSIIFIDLTTVIPVTRGIALLLGAFGDFVYYSGAQSYQRNLEILSAMEILKTHLADDLKSTEDLEYVDDKLIRAY